MVAAVLLYWVAEIAFNGYLLEVASSAALDPDALERAKTLGRTLAGLGFALLLASLAVAPNGIRLPAGLSAIASLIALTALAFAPLSLSQMSEARWASDLAIHGDPRHYRLLLVAFGIAIATAALCGRGALSRLAFVTAIVLAAFPAMYLGQKMAIEAAVVEPSRAEQRLEARLLGFARAAAMSGAVQIGDWGGDDSASSRTLAAYLGLMIPGSERGALIEAAEGHKRALVRRALIESESRLAEAAWQDYRAASERIREQAWPRYRDGVERLHEAIAGAREEATGHWEALVERARESYADYQQATREHWREVSARRDELHAGFAQAHDRKDAPWCESRCEERLVSRYERSIAEHFERVPPLDYWCAGGDCPARGEAFDNKLLALASDTFEARTGHPYTLKSESEFIAHPATVDQARERLERTLGASLPSGWDFGDANGAVLAIESAIEARARERWRERMREAFGGALPSDLDYAAFEAHPVIQDRIRGGVEGLARGGEPIRLGLERNAFRERYILPAAEREVEGILATLASAQRYRDGGDLAETGRDAVRALMIPPIGLALSLLFALTTTAKLASPAMSRALQGACLRLGRVRLAEAFDQRPGLMRPLAAVLGLVLLIEALALLSAPAVERFATYRHYRAVSAEERPLATYAIDRLIRAQATIAPASLRLYAAVEGLGAGWSPGIGAETDASTAGVVRVSAARLRAEPTTASRQVGSLRRGEALTIAESRKMGDGHTWHRLAGRPQEAWIRGDLVEVR